MLTVGRQGNDSARDGQPDRGLSRSRVLAGRELHGLGEHGATGAQGAIADGPGDAGNPLILRNYQDGLTVANLHNAYAGPTISTYTGGEEGGSQRWGIVFVAEAGWGKATS